MKRKTIFVAALVAALSCGSAISSFAAGWESVGADWKYVKDDGKYAAAEWVNPADGKWYYLKADTIMAKGWIPPVETDNHWYFADSNGALVAGLVEINGNVYYLNETHDGTYGALYEGVKVINGINYTFTVNGTTGSKPYTSKQYHSDGSAVAVRTSQAYSGSGSISDGWIPSPQPESTPDKIEKVDEAVADIKNSAAVDDVTVTATSERTRTVNVVMNDAFTESSAQQAVVAAAEAVFEEADEAIVTVSVYGVSKPKEFTTPDEALDWLNKNLDTWVTPDMYEKHQSGSVTVLMNKERVTYTITLTEAGVTATK